MVKQSAKESTAVHAALQYAARGWHVLPLNSKNAPAAGGAGVKDATTDEAQIRRWWEQYPTAGVGIAAEPSGLVIIDLDRKGDVDGFASWDALLLPDVNTHKGPRARTRNGGQHLFYDRDDVMYSSTVGKIGTGIDVRCYGGYVAASPTPGYVWLSEGETVPPPGSVCQVLTIKGRPKKGTVTPLKTGDPARRGLTAHLESAPESDTGRNDWTTVLAGYAAKIHYPDRATFEAYVHKTVQDRIAHFNTGDDFNTAAVEKICESIWTTEERKHEDAGYYHADNGWLRGSGAQLWTRVPIKEDKEVTWVAMPWADFDMEALGVVDDEHAERTYDVNLQRRTKGDVRRCDLPASALADAKRLDGWLAQHGVSILPPAEPAGFGSRNGRLLRYLEAQHPPTYRATPSLGWYHGQFITHEGTIDPEHGLVPYTDTKPAAILKQWAPFTYGFDVNEHDAVAALREVLTFHDTTITAVFGAWWAACYMKPLLPGQFPFMLIEALSGAGKTEGFFGLMHAMTGNTAGPLTATRAALRDYLSGHNAGPQWIDDPDDTAAIEELLRAMTAGASVAKKGEDNTQTALVSLCAPLMLSGEGFPTLHNQRAYTNRAVLLDPPEVSHRKSLHDPDVDQYRDLLLFKKRYPQPQVMAGTLARLFIKHGTEMLVDLPTANIGGRNAAHHRILLFGAELLARVTGDKRYPRQVAEWCAQEATIDRTENALTLEVIPAALVILGTDHKTAAHPLQGIFGMPDLRPPVLCRGTEMLVHAETLYEWWNHHNHGRIDQRTASKAALAKQLKQVSDGRRLKQRTQVDRTSNERAYYRALRSDVAEACWLRAFDQPSGVYQDDQYTHQETLPMALDEPTTDYRAYWCDSDGTAFDAL